MCAGTHALKRKIWSKNWCTQKKNENMTNGACTKINEKIDSSQQQQQANDFLLFRRLLLLASHIIMCVRRQDCETSKNLAPKPLHNNYANKILLFGVLIKYSRTRKVCMLAFTHTHMKVVLAFCICFFLLARRSIHLLCC